MAKMNVYEVVTNQIISHLEKGVIPWKQPWKPGQEAINWFTGKPYRGINKLLTRPGGEYATFLQITNAGGKVKKGEKSTPVVFFTTGEKENEDGEKETYRYYTVYKVFEINTQCTGLQSKRVLDESVAELNSIEEAEKLIEAYADRPEIRYVSGKASYSPIMDLVSVPPMGDYKVLEEYYCTLYHELIHSTGSANRLNREKGKAFGDEKYSKEELVAEIGAAMLCGLAGIEQATIENSAAYIDSWLKVFSKDTRMVLTAAREAQKAVDYMVGKEIMEVKCAS